MAAEMIGIVKEYLKMTQETLIPQFKEGLAEAIAANTLDKNTFTTTVTSFEQKLLQENELVKKTMKMDANPVMQELPQPLQEMIAEVQQEIINEWGAKSAGMYEAWFEIFSTDGLMSEAQLETCLTLCLPTTAQEKYDQMWGLLDTDNDGKITKDEAVSFVNKLVNVAIAGTHLVIEVNKSVAEKMATRVAAVVLEAHSPEGITYEETMGYAEDPETLMMAVQAAIMGKDA